MRRSWLLRFMPVAAALVLAVVARALVFQVVAVQSASMAATLVPGDRVLVFRPDDDVIDFERGDVVVFENPLSEGPLRPSVLARVIGSLSRLLGFDTEERWLVKRVIGLPGDTVEGSNGSVFLSGMRLAPVCQAEVRHVQ